MKKKETLAQEALRLLKDIPEKQWITNYFSDGVFKCCALGHYNRLKSEDPSDFNIDNCYEKDRSLRELTQKFLEKKKCWSNIALINNGFSLEVKINGKIKKTNEDYISAGPKKRTILFLEWMVAEGY